SYRGLRRTDGQELAVIDLTGTMNGKGSNSDMKGEARGDAVYDLATRRFLQVRVNFELDMRIKFLGETVRAEGIMDVELKRGTVTALPSNLPTMDMFATTPEQTGGLYEAHRLSSAGGELKAMAFSSDGFNLAAVAGGNVVIWETSSGRMIKRIPIGASSVR